MRKTDLQLIRDYLDGKLGNRAMYELERRAEDNPMLMDMLGGMECAPQPEHDENLADIDRRIRERVDTRPTRRLFDTRWAVAASVVLVLGLGVWQLAKQDQQEAPPLTIQRRITPHAAQPSPFGSPTAEQDTRVTEQVAQARKPRERKERTPIAYDRVAAAAMSKSEAKPVVAAMASRRSRDTVALNEVVIHGNAAPVERTSVTAAIATVNGNALRMVKGKVLAANDRSPLPGASIVVKGNPNSSTSTNANGEFAVLLPDKSTTLMVSSVGYRTREIKVKANDSISVVLRSDGAVVAEVVAAGNSRKVSAASPVNGWPAFNDYIKANTPSADKKYKTKLELRISGSGEVLEIRVRKGADSVLNEQAERLVRDAGNWRGRSDGKTSTVRVTVKFEKSNR